MRLIWTADARRDAANVFEYISERNPVAAEKIADRLILTAERLVDHPHLYRSGRIAGTREAVAHPNYILVYRVGSDLVEILAVLHTRQNYP